MSEPCNNCPMYCEDCVITGRAPPCEKRRRLFAFDDRSTETVDSIRARGFAIREIPLGDKTLYLPETPHE